MRFRGLVFCSVLLVSGVLLAEPKAPPKVSATAEASYKKALKEGRALHLKKKYKEAVASFEAALKAIPDDPRALSELGYAAYFAKDYTLALEATQKSIERAIDPKLKAASLYNLGLILEATSKKKEAADAYVASLKLRDNKTVLGKLKALDPALATSYLGLTPKQLDEYASRKELCTEIMASDSSYADEPEGEDFKEALNDCLKNLSDEMKKPPSPYLSAGFIHIFNPTNAGESPSYLVLKTKAGLFASYLFSSGGSSGWYGSDIGEIKIEAQPVGSTNLLLVRYKTSSFENTETGFFNSGESTWLKVCGVGSSGKPSCLDSIQLSSSYSSYKYASAGELEDDPTEESAWKVEDTITKDGVLELKGNSKNVDYSTARLLGKHTLVFP